MQLGVGDVVYISGQAFTCRSRLHRWVFDEGHPLPAEAKKRDVLIHVGPIVIPKNGGWRLVSFMPTSSIRFEKWGAQSVDEWGLRMIVGKTTMGPETTAMMVEKKCVHVSPHSVSPNLWIGSIEIEGVDLYEELGSIEATWYMKLRDLGPFVVDIDTQAITFTPKGPLKLTGTVKALEELGIRDFKYASSIRRNDREGVQSPLPTGIVRISGESFRAGVDF